MWVRCGGKISSKLESSKCAVWVLCIGTQIKNDFYDLIIIQINQ